MSRPWCLQAVAVRNLYPSAELVQLPSAGHCPHDDTPAEANAALLKWIDQLPQASIIENAASQAASQAA
jgi:pimeloyl-ACP methyl ester carboxylesterase